MGGRAGRWFAAVSLSIALVLAAGRASADESCLKRVFGRYCLAGDAAALLQAGPPPVARETKGDSLALVYPEATDRIYVLAFSNRIYKVVRAYQVSTQLRYDDIYSLLRDKYGPGEDQSRFPDYATTPARRLASIRRGDGRALHVWNPTETWHIELSWTRELGLSLAYIANAIQAERAAHLEGGL